MRQHPILFICFFLLCFGLYTAGARADALSDCSTHIPWGAPATSDGAPVDLVCHKGYLSGLDAAAKEPRWVSYELTGPHTLGCFPRTGLQFRVDPLAPAEHQGRLGDYSHSGYDLGHMAPNQDFAWDKDEQRDTFSFANVSPQRPGLNRQGWERGEEIVRAWAFQRGDLQVYVGPILASGDGKLGDDAVDIPVAFFKVVVDRQSGESLGFVMPQQDIAKGPIEPFVTPISTIESRAHVSLPLPANGREATSAWPADLSAVNAAHREACAR